MKVRTCRINLSWALVASALVFGGCSDKGDDNPTGPGNGGGTLMAKWGGSDGIGVFFQQRCTPCHISQSQNGYNLSTYANAMSGGRITPGDANGSYLVMKISPNPPAGDRMPQGGPYLTTAQIDTIKVWINAGAMNN